jgi:hypothetical protein
MTMTQGEKGTWRNSETMRHERAKDPCATRGRHECDEQNLSSDQTPEGRPRRLTRAVAVDRAAATDAEDFQRRYLQVEDFYNSIVARPCFNNDFSRYSARQSASALA